MNSVAKIMSFSIVTNIFLALIKIVSGLIGRSGALVADGIHSLSDLVTDFFAIIGSHMASKPADDEHPYGHGKAEYITSIVIGAVVLILGFSIIKESFESKIVIPSILVVIVSLITIVCKYLLSLFIITKGKKLNNNILIASGTESKTDVLSSIVVLVSAIFMLLSKKITIFKYADKIAIIIVGLFIIRVGFTVIKENIGPILGEKEQDPKYIKEITNIILSSKGIKHIDSFTLLKYGSYYKLICTVSMDGNLKLKQAHKLIDDLENNIKTFDNRILYITVHMEPV